MPKREAAQRVLRHGVRTQPQSIRLRHKPNTSGTIGTELPEDPILARIKQRHLPIIWIIGEPTKSIKNIFTDFCHQLSDTFGFKYISLDQQIAAWYEREIMSTPGKYWKTVNHQKKHQKSPLGLVPPHKGTQLKICAKITDSLQLVSHSYDRKLRAFIKSSQAAPNSALLNTPKLTEITLDTSEALSQDKLMELLKYAMVEEMTPLTRGFLLEASFSDRSDLQKFKQSFYPPTLGIYFTESVINEAIGGASQKTRNSPDFNRLLKSKVKLELPRNYKRSKDYAFQEVENLCGAFRNRVIRVVNAEHLKPTTLQYIMNIIRTQLAASTDGDPTTAFDTTVAVLTNSDIPNDSSADTQNFAKRNSTASFQHVQDGRSPKTRDSAHAATSAPPPSSQMQPKHAFPSPSAMVSRSTEEISDIASPDRRQSILIDRYFGKIKALNLPLIWIYGYHQTAISEQRKSCSRFLAKYFDFKFLQMDEQILRWHRYYLNLAPGKEPENMNDLIFFKAKQIIKKVMPNFHRNKDHFLTKEESHELIKYAMLHAMPTNGFILDNFPFSRADGLEFERKIYPAAVGIYFCSRQRTTNKKIEPTIDRPKYFLRSSHYSENTVDGICSAFRHKTIKVINVEDLKDSEMSEICKMVARYLLKYLDGTKPQFTEEDSGKTQNTAERNPQGVSVQPEAVLVKNRSWPLDLKADIPSGTVAGKNRPIKVTGPGRQMTKARRRDDGKVVAEKSKMSVGVNVDTLSKLISKAKLRQNINLVDAMNSPIQSKTVQQSSVVKIYARQGGRSASESELNLFGSQNVDRFQSLMSPSIQFEALESYALEDAARSREHGRNMMRTSMQEFIEEYNPDDFLAEKFSARQDSKTYTEDYRPVVDGIVPIPVSI